MMKKTWITAQLIIPLLMMPLMAGPAKVVHNFAHIGDGTGLRTVFMVTNQNQESLTITIQLFQDNGSPLSLTIEGETASTFQKIVPAGGTLRLATSNGATLVAGWARLTADKPVAAQVLFDIFSGPSLVTQAAVESTSPVRLVEGFAQAEPGTQTGIAFANLSETGSIRIRITLRKADGTDLGTAEIELGPHGQTASIFATLFPQAGDFGSGSFTVQSSGPMAITILQQTGLVLGSLPFIDPLL